MSARYQTFQPPRIMLVVLLNFSYAAAPPVFAAIMTSVGPHAARWLALAMSISAFCAPFGLLLLQRRMNRTSQRDRILIVD